MSRRNLYFISALAWAVLEVVMLLLTADHLYREVMAHTVFRLPFSLFFVGLIRGYWWIPLISVPLLSWASVGTYVRLKQRQRLLKNPGA
jgi:hypothetical protein